MGGFSWWGSAGIVAWRWRNLSAYPQPYLIPLLAAADEKRKPKNYIYFSIWESAVSGDFQIPRDGDSEERQNPARRGCGKASNFQKFTAKTPRCQGNRGMKKNRLGYVSAAVFVSAA
jgi:hypothetical protein